MNEAGGSGRTIQVNEEDYRRLAKLREGEETVADTIRRICEFYEVGTLRRHRALDVEELEFPVELTPHEKETWLEFLRTALEVGEDMTYVSEVGWGVLENKKNTLTFYRCERPLFRIQLTGYGVFYKRQVEGDHLVWRNIGNIHEDAERLKAEVRHIWQNTTP